MSQTELQVWERDTTLTPRQLRAAGYVPATLYGKDLEPACVQVRTHEFTLLCAKGVRAAKLTGFLNMSVEIKSVQVEPISHIPVSIQFWQPGAAGSAKSKSGKKAKETATAGAK